MSQKQKNPYVLDLNYDPFGGQWEIYDGPFMVGTAAEESYARLFALAPALVNVCHALLSSDDANKLLRSAVIEKQLEEIFCFLKPQPQTKQSRKKPATSKRAPSKKR